MRICHQCEFSIWVIVIIELLVICWFGFVVICVCFLIIGIYIWIWNFPFIRCINSCTFIVDKVVVDVWWGCWNFIVSFSWWLIEIESWSVWDLCYVRVFDWSLVEISWIGVVGVVMSNILVGFRNVIKVGCLVIVEVEWILIWSWCVILDSVFCRCGRLKDWVIQRACHFYWLERLSSLVVVVVASDAFSWLRHCVVAATSLVQSIDIGICYCLWICFECICIRVVVIVSCYKRSGFYLVVSVGALLIVIERRSTWPSVSSMNCRIFFIKVFVVWTFNIRAWIFILLEWIWRDVIVIVWGNAFCWSTYALVSAGVLVIGVQVIVGNWLSIWNVWFSWFIPTIIICYVWSGLWNVLQTFCIWIVEVQIGLSICFGCWRRLGSSIHFWVQFINTRINCISRCPSIHSFEFRIDSNASSKTRVSWVHRDACRFRTKCALGVLIASWTWTCWNIPCCLRWRDCWILISRVGEINWSFVWNISRRWWFIIVVRSDIRSRSFNIGKCWCSFVIIVKICGL